MTISISEVRSEHRLLLEVYAPDARLATKRPRDQALPTRYVPIKALGNLDHRGQTFLEPGRDPLFTVAFRETLAATGVKTV